MNQDREDPRRAIRRLNLFGFAAVILLVGGLGGWAATSRLSGAVIAPGTLVVESNVKKVQHATGGIVGEILVTEGSVVEAGNVVMRLDATTTKATLGVVRSQLDELTAKEARLLAERDGAESPSFPEDLDVRKDERSVAAAIAGETKLFESRRNVLVGQRAQLRERVSQSNQEVRGLLSQQEAKERAIALIARELPGLLDLREKGLVSLPRVLELERTKAQLEGQQGEYVAGIARARGKITETGLQIIQVDQDFRTEVLKELQDAQGRIAELRERLAAAEDQLRRVEIRSPQAGIVYQLAVHTVGGVIAGGETVMQIVPRADALVVEAKVAPRDIDQIAVGSTGLVRIMAGNQRTIPTVAGVLTRISADLNRDPQTGGQEGLAYYLVRLSLSEKQVSRLGDLHLVPGMQAEVFFETYAQTPLEYLLKPLSEQIARTFRER